MIRKPLVRVVKRGERERLEQEAARSAGLKKSAHEAARTQVATVTNWIEEFRQKRRQECQAIELLLDWHQNGSVAPKLG